MANELHCICHLPLALCLPRSEAVEVAASDPTAKYALGSVLSHVLLHQTVIGEEALQQLAMVGETPDLVIGCTGGGSNFGGLAFPLLREKMAGNMNPIIRAVEPEACPSLTRGVYAYDFGDTAGLTPLLKMHTLGERGRWAFLGAGGRCSDGASAGAGVEAASCGRPALAVASCWHRQVGPVSRAEPSAAPSTQAVTDVIPRLLVSAAGAQFIPDPIHAGGLRYHGMSPLISHVKELGLIEAVAVPQVDCFKAALQFSQTEGIVPAPEPTHALAEAIKEALKCRWAQCHSLHAMLCCSCCLCSYLPLPAVRQSAEAAS